MARTMSASVLLTVTLVAVGTFYTVGKENTPGRHANASKPPAAVGHPSMESPHVNPIAVSGGRVFVANTPAGTVDVIDAKTRTVVRRIPVGVDPVSIAVRPDGKEVWVANHVSDSISVIDTDEKAPTYLHVIATVQEFDPKTKATKFDEPVGIAFAGNDKAYVALSSENQIAVIDVASRKITKRLTIPAQDPRAIVVRGERLYVVPFESGNKTQLSGGTKDQIDGDLVTFDAYEHSIRNNNVLSLGHVVDIVKQPKVPDRDLFVFDTRTDQLVEALDTLGTLLYGLAVDSKGNAFIAQTDARNDVNGRSGTKKHGLKEMENRAFLNRITKVGFKDGKAEKPTFFDLEPLPPKNPEKGMALATPFAIQVSNDDSTLIATAAASDKLFTVDAATGEVLGRVDVGAGPRGIALAEKAAWVLNALDNRVSVVDLSDPAKPKAVSNITLEDPTHPVFKRGRIAFNSAKASTTGTFSCASCHPDGHTDQLLWVLDTPIVTGGNQIMPRSTMPARGLRDTEPFHWDGIPGDPYGGIHSASTRKAVEPNSKLGVPTSSTRHLIDEGLASTMHRVGDTAKNNEGKLGELSAKERDDMAVYLLGVPYAPAPKRAYTDELSDRAKTGFRLFHIDGDHDPKQRTANVCGNCHRMPFLVSTNTPGTGMDAPTWRGAQDRWLILPQGRLNIIEFPFYRTMAEQGAPERNIWQMSWGGRSRFDPVWDMVLEMGTGFSGAFARQLTLSKATAKDALTADLLDALEKAASDGAVVLECDGVMLKGKAEPVTLQFTGGRYIPKDGDRAAFTRGELLGLVSDGQFLGTVVARHGAKASVDHPQPALWTLGPIEKQRGRQDFPILHPDQKAMTVSGRHFGDDARLFVNGRRVEGTVSAESGEKDEKVVITLAALPPVGLHFLQVQVPDGMFSNEFIIHVAKDADTAAELKRELIRISTAPWDGLNAALLRGDLAAVKKLVPDKATANKRLPDGTTPLGTTAQRGQVEIAKYLLEIGADPSGMNTDGNTPLHAAAFLCHEELVKILLEKGASVTMKNGRGDTPIDAVSGEWSLGLADFYTGLGSALSIKIDLKQLEQDRPKIAKLLRAQGEKTKDGPAPAAKAPTPKIDPADWAMYNHDPAGWRFNSAEKTLGPSNVGKIVEKWQFPAADSKETIGVVHATPTVVNGEVYFGTATFPAFYKLDAKGKQVWVYRNPKRKDVLPPASGEPITDKLRGAASDGGILGSALVIDNAVYFADTAGWMYCLDAATGKEKWTVNARGKEFPGSHWMNMFFGSPILANGKVVFAGGTLEQLIAGTSGYPGSTGRGFLVALESKTGTVAWKHDVGPKPEKLDPPVVIEGTWGKYKFDHGPATSSVWSTPSYDPDTNTLFFGTDVNTAPRQPTKENPNLHTEDSCAIVAIDATTGKRKWNTQINPGDVWTNSMRGYDPKTRLYKDCSIGDTPKLFIIELDGKPTKVVGAGCKNGGFYVLRADDGKLVRQTPVYSGKPTHPPEKHDPRILALPSPIGGLQSGCATDGKTIFTNGIDAVRLTTQESPYAPGQMPTGGRVTATSLDLKTELWRHERPKIPEMGGTKDKPMYKDVGDIVGSGVAVGNGVAYFTTVGSGKLIALDGATGKVLKEIDLGPVFCGPSLSRGRVYVGGGNTLFSANEAESFFPKQYTGSVRCFGLPDDDGKPVGDNGKPGSKNPDGGKPAAEMSEAEKKAFVEKLLAEKGLLDPRGWNFPKTALEYAKMAESELGVPPKIDLSESVEIPIYVDGVQKYGNLGRSCDNPSMLGKDTVSGSALQRYEGRTADGKPLPDVVWVSFARNSTRDPKKIIGSVQMIGYNKKSGATAFFESCDQIQPWVRLDKDTLRMRGVMPWIDEPEEFNKAYRVPDPLRPQCVQCHQADPFITNSFINAAKIPGTKKTVVPILDHNSPYYIIGGENWDMRTIHIEGNKCFDCHRVGLSTLSMFMENGWKPNKHMPPHDPGSLAKDLEQLLTAWKDGPDRVKGAKWVIPPARGEEGKVVGDDYPNKAHFNRPPGDKKPKPFGGEKPGEAKKELPPVFRFVNQTGGQFADADCYWSLDHGKTWHSFADEPTVPCPVGNGRVYFRLGAAPKNFDDRTARWDFIEYALDKAGWHGNTTQVDAFCIPITISLGDKEVGITQSPRSLIAAFRKDAPKEFQKCAESDLWILSPCRAGFGATGPHAKYFDEYIAGVWAKYAKKQTTPSGKWVGEVTGEKLTFTPVGGGASVSCEKKPTTQDAFLGTGVLATNPRFCAAINRHVLDDPADWNDPAKFFLAEPYNWYAKFFHEHGLGKKAYGFCYDDVGDQASFFSGKGNEVVVTLYGDKTADKGPAEKPNPATWRAPDDVTFRTANITSEGTRMAAEVFAPKNPKSDKLPTIVMSHGWGGTAEALRPDAVKFAQAGYLVVAFDYRGWGNSDSRLISVGKPEKKDGKLIAEVSEVRGVVDPIDQTTDILNAISWAAGEKLCDKDRIGIWGSSFSGGHVVYVAARDPRVKAFVSQVGSMDGRWVLSPTVRKYTFDQAAARTRGKIGYPKPLEKFGTLTGSPVIEKFVGYAPIEDIGRCKDVAKLFIIAEKEELFDNKDHALLAHERATGPKKLVTIKDIKHYGIYNEARDQAQKEAIAWFDEHLKNPKAVTPGK